MEFGELQLPGIISKILSLTAQQSLHQDTESATMCILKNF